ncbi:MAG: cellulase family glycosylhydrolase [Chloroflexi bacterium]|nr:cellulase family glycosylhydrolase [Chloroflexota bacterium]
MPKVISHALVLPDRDFNQWYQAAQAYIQKFERVAVIRSPRGFNLNRFRNITAVAAPAVWMSDNAVEHIRRVYPAVVRVDVVRATTPEELRSALAARVAANDRYGETINSGRHLDDRFVLDWPVSAAGSRIVQGFNSDLGDGKRLEGLMIAAPRGTQVKAGIGGVVATVIRQQTALGFGEYVQISTNFRGQAYLVTYAGLQNISVQAGANVSSVSAIGQSGGDAIRLVVQTPGRGLGGYQLPDVVDPTPLIYWEGLRLRSISGGLRIREKPGTQFNVLTTVFPIDFLEPMEQHGRTLLKIGQQDQWALVRAPNGIEAHAAAWLMTTLDMDDVLEVFPGVNPVGINLDVVHPLGKPRPERLGRMGWVRLPYNVSYNPDNNTYGNTDIEGAFRRYQPYIRQYAAAGYKVMLVLTHQTFGEGAGYVWPQMGDNDWRGYAARFGQVVGQVARQFAGQNLVHAYQIWNEQDAPHGAGSSVTLSPQNYAAILAESIRAIRGVDRSALILTGGHTGGPVAGPNYARATLAALPAGVAPDGIATHPYGRGVTVGVPYAIFGHIDEEIRNYGAIFPERPLWITEWGVLDRPDDNPADVTRYASEIINYVRARYAGKIATLLWYAWAQGMHNGYGLVGTNDQPRQPLYDQFTRG